MRRASLGCGHRLVKPAGMVTRTGMWSLLLAVWARPAAQEPGRGAAAARRAQHWRFGKGHVTPTTHPRRVVVGAFIINLATLAERTCLLVWRTDAVEDGLNQLGEVLPRRRVEDVLARRRARHIVDELDAI